MSRSERRAMIVRDHPALSPEPAMPPAVGRTFLALLRADEGERRDARADAADRRAVPEIPVLRPPVGWRFTLRREGVRIGRRRAARLMRLMGLQAIYRAPRTSAPPPRAPGLPLSAAGSGDRAAEPCLVRRHHLYPGEPRLPLPGGDHGLGEPVRPGLAAVEHAGCELLHRHARRGPDPA